MGGRRVLCSGLVAGALVAGCTGAEAVKGVESEEPPKEHCSTRAPDGQPSFRSCIGLAPLDAVDLLFVVDDGPLAAPLQARLADALPAFLDAVAQLQPQVDLRIGFTTAHDGNPACETRPGSRGALHLASCRQHPEDFVDADGTDHFEQLCAARCGLDDIAAEPSPTLLDPEAMPRPWLDLGPGSNLPTGVDPAEALACAAMLGTGGCPLTAPLASAAQSIQRHGTADPSAGFWRPTSAPIIAVVSGSHECSVGDDGATAFDPEGDRSLWTDPEGVAATPAVCWNAGVECIGDACTAVDKGANGGAAAPDAAILEPIDRLLDAFDRLAQARQQAIPDIDVTVALLTGVPEGWSPGEALMVADAPDPQTARDLGVAPACHIDETPLVPPVRLLALAEAVDRPGAVDVSVASACTDDYGPALAGLVEAIGAQVRPLCMPGCVADTDDADGLQVDCTLEASVPMQDGTVDRHALLPCVRDSAGTVDVPPGSGCWDAITGAQLHPTCTEIGLNLEIRLRWDGPRPPSMSIHPQCELSDEKSRDCPNLP
ncbi:MAG: hypothetical protein AAF721_20115 [Myxococcota bacterium]